MRVEAVREAWTGQRTFLVIRHLESRPQALKVRGHWQSQQNRWIHLYVDILEKFISC